LAKMKERSVNIVFFPHSANFGLAGTNRLQNIIFYLKRQEDTTVYNIALEDRSKLLGAPGQQEFIQEYKEIYYAPTVGLFIKHLFQTSWYLLKVRKKGSRNVIYFYGEVDIKNFFFVLWARLVGYKIVIDVVEDLDAHIKFRSLKNKLKYKSAVFFRKHLGWFADGFTAVSTHLSDKLQVRFPTIPLFFLPVTINKHLMDASAGSRTDRPANILYSGSFNEKDGLIFMLEALAGVKSAGQSFTFILSGKGTPSEMESFWSAVKAFGLESDVDYRGFLERGAYIKILTEEADVLCMTRINSAYANAGFPFKLGEFLSTGKPVIASRVGDVEKYLTLRDAYLVEPENPEEIKKALLHAITHPDLSTEIGRNGRKVAMAWFDHERYANELTEFMTNKI
jgi:glycosyltransferase involved in cell wall biosynthesis